MILYLTRKLNALYPSSPSDLDKLHKLEKDGVFKCKVTRPRNLKHNRKYWALVNLVYSNLPEHLDTLFSSPDDLHREFKFQAGLYDIHRTLGGKEIPQVRSTSFEKMNQDEFEEYYEKCLHVISKHIMPGITEEELRSQLLEF